MKDTVVVCLRRIFVISLWGVISLRMQFRTRKVRLLNRVTDYDIIPVGHLPIIGSALVRHISDHYIAGGIYILAPGIMLLYFWSATNAGVGWEGGGKLTI